MKEPAARVRFRAIDVLRLLDLAVAGKLDELWFVRGLTCKLKLPDLSESVKPAVIEGDHDIIVDTKDYERVEILELHNHVLRTLRNESTVPEDNTFVDVCFTDEEEFCLVLCCDRPREITEETSYTWMSDLFSRRLF